MTFAIGAGVLSLGASIVLSPAKPPQMWLVATRLALAALGLLTLAWGIWKVWTEAKRPPNPPAPPPSGAERPAMSSPQPTPAPSPTTPSPALIPTPAPVAPSPAPTPAPARPFSAPTAVLTPRVAPPSGELDKERRAAIQEMAKRLANAQLFNQEDKAMMGALGNQANVSGEELLGYLCTDFRSNMRAYWYGDENAIKNGARKLTRFTFAWTLGNRLLERKPEARKPAIDWFLQQVGKPNDATHRRWLEQGACWNLLTELLREESPQATPNDSKSSS